MTKSTKNRSEKPLGKMELVAIALGGMVGGGIFSILGISVEMIGDATPIAIFLGGVLAYFAAFSYSKLAVYYEDEGATYSFFLKTFPNKSFLISLIGWFIVFGYISTLALYAYTFASYFEDLLPWSFFGEKELIALCVLLFFAGVNLVSVNSMGKIGYFIVMTGALFATSSAINGTIYGASRLIAVIAKDGVFPTIFAKRKKQIPYISIIVMTLLSYIFILSGELQFLETRAGRTRSPSYLDGFYQLKLNFLRIKIKH